MFVSHKRRKSNGNRFAFVRFKKLEEAESTMRNLNGIKVRVKVLMVSFSKYDRNRQQWSSFVHLEDNNGDILTGKAKNSNGDLRDGRSFKEVVEGLSHTSNRCVKEVDDCDKDHSMANMKLLKGLLERVMYDFFSALYLKEVKQKCVFEIVNALSSVLGDDEIMVMSQACRPEDGTSQRCEVKEKTGVFLEAQLINSMMHRVQNESFSSIGGYDHYLVMDYNFLRSPKISYVRKRGRSGWHV